MSIRNSLLFLMLISLSVVSAQDNIIDEIVWVVGDEPILRSEVESQRLQAQAQGVKFSGDPYCVIPEQLAIQKLFLHQADLDSIVVSDNDVMADVDRRINSDINQIGSKEKLEEYYGKPLSRIREMYRDQARNNQLVSTVQRGLIGSITVTPGEIRQFYNNMKVDSIPMVPAEVEVDIITAEPQYDPTEITEIKDKLREFPERVNTGSNFSTLAVMYSDDRNSAKVGGELGFMGKGELMPEFANVAFSLSDPKKVSKIVQTDYGFHIIQLIEKRGDRINCRHILLKPHISASERNQALLRLDSIAELIRNQKMTFQGAAQYYSFDKDTRNNGGLMVNPKSGTSRFQLEDLPSEVGKLVYTMNVGEVSKPFTMINLKDKEVCAIIRVKSKTKAHKANLTDDFQLLKQMVQSSKSEKIIADWIVQKQKKTYVHIDDKWSNCEFQHSGWVRK
ncbi:MAG: peptidylprolyl isomerase [Bacteroidia bacterium]|nr:peptidylprolyl isomerase [Bacteroidia bacterium]